MDIKTHQNNMTLFYSKKTGEIKSYATGIQDMNYFGNDKEDYTLIWDYVVIPRDDKVIRNLEIFKINLDTKELTINF